MIINGGGTIMWLFWDQYKKMIALCVIPVIVVVGFIGFEIKLGQSGGSSKPLTANQAMKVLLDEQKEDKPAKSAPKESVDPPKKDNPSIAAVTPNDSIPPETTELPTESDPLKPSIKPKKTPKPTASTSKVASQSSKTNFIIHLNTASSAELMELSGIGESKAKAIIAYRQAHPFQTIDDLMNVKGIGPKIFAKIKVHLEL